MKNILKLFYDCPGDWRENNQTSDFRFAKTARIKSENLDLLMDSFSDKQKELFERYCQADAEIEDMINFDQFCYAFHLGAQLMAEIIRGEDELLSD
ncbi:hypothetical protein NE619_06070 [Anaerovorax odorimutans]|uniref:Phage protein n=1 Tax=Anaerovorax odorimutans TaxID=109327 RepID=A0ABT1RM70_9FIRM|nr:DUF6809 family protein [Anaerovorax odorimutans]MCQ4636289.1 hypothetical protein [Anaerovorax odorimutans]